MMRIISFHIILFIIAFSGGLLQAQNKKALDSILKSGTLQVYDRPDEAIKIGKYVARTSEDIRLKTNGLMLVSDAYSSKRDYEKSLEYVIKAKNIAADSDNLIIRIKILTKIAIQYQQLKIYDKAIEYLDESNALAQAYPNKDSIRVLIGNSFIIRGFIYKEQLNCDIAIAYFKQGIEEYREAKTPMVNANLSIVNYNIGNCYIRLYDNESAKKSFNESIMYAKKVNANSLLAFAQKGLAEVYTLEGKYKEAIAVLLEAVAVSESVGDLVLNQGIYKGLSENYLARNEWENYRKFHQKYLETNVKIKASERKSVSDSLNESGANQKLKAEIVKKKYISGIILLAILSFAIVVLSLILHQKSVRKIIKLQEKIQNLQKKNL